MAVDPEIVVAAAGRPVASEAVSGDAWQLDWREHGCRIAVIDGLGHGPEAAAAAAAATAALAASPERSPLDAMELCHRALQGTRGAAMWIGAIERSAGAGQLAWAGVGNVEARLWQAGRDQRLVAQRGIVGAVLPRLRTFESALEQDWLLLIHTDGIRERFTLEAGPDHLRENPQQLADGLLLAWARPTDDALVVALRANAST
jgi:serine phosphatase RsbU (regulator of sigma subunit)